VAKIIVINICNISPASHSYDKKVTQSPSGDALDSNDTRQRTQGRMDKSLRGKGQMNN